MNPVQAVILGVVEGVTEFLPVSSTGHLTIVEKMMSLPLQDKGVTAFTAIIQIGAIAAAFVYFFKDIVAIVKGFVGGLLSSAGRQTFEWKMSLAVIIGTIPIAIVGKGLKKVIEEPLRNLYVVGAALILWTAVMVAAEVYHRKLAKSGGRHDAESTGQVRHEHDLTLMDALVIGLAQCIALVPGVSRSGATISAGLFRGLDRVAATRLSFFLAIPALTAAAALEGVSARKDIGAAHNVTWTAVGIGTVVSFVVAYFSIAWLLKFVVNHPISAFGWYRVTAGILLIGALAVHLLSAT